MSRLSGSIIDSETSQPIQGVSISILTSEGAATGKGTVSNSNGEFSLSGPELAAPNWAAITHVSYEPVYFPVGSIDQTGTVPMKKDITELDPVIVTGSKKDNSWLWLVAIAAAAKMSAKHKAVGKIDSGTVMTVSVAAVALIGFTGVKKILESLHIWDSKEAKNVKAEIENNNSPFSPAFWKAAPAGSLLLTQAAMTQIGQELLDSFGAWDDDETKAIGVFKKFKTQSQVSQFADVWLNQYKFGDLLLWLLGDSYPNDRLDNEDVDQIITIVKSLPKYKP